MRRYVLPCSSIYHGTFSTESPFAGVRFSPLFNLQGCILLRNSFAEVHFTRNSIFAVHFTAQLHLRAFILPCNSMYGCAFYPVTPFTESQFAGVHFSPPLNLLWCILLRNSFAAVHFTPQLNFRCTFYQATPLA